ncbi:hypothetical protein [Pyxidicoccus sp. MSG2]|uniref:hypothetical protein n=1 Tax=Pyxidicoccus sp. MSG2 TaxID=2996790 RepID=UPI00226E1008|nr:hypothetical protein [Pyxidicoccus sp. MSG2]MCY1023871.1 hypothetical protein [Pyxidicoccus sp. MSG2]
MHSPKRHEAGAVSRWRSSVGWAVAVLLTAVPAAARAPDAVSGAARPASVVRALGLTAMQYGQQFVVTCEDDDPSPFFYPGPGCARVEGMSFDIHRDNWSSNYLNYDDPQDPSNAGLLTRQGYISLQLADPTAYKALALLKAYQATGRTAFLQRFRHAFLRQILDKQLPSTALGLGAVQTFQASYFPDPQQDVTLDATGAFANSATLAGGVDGVLGTADDVLTWMWNGHAGFNFAALAEVLATYAQLTGDTQVLPAVERAGRFLLRLERRTPTGEPEGSWAYGVAPANGFPNRMTTGIIGVTLLKLSTLPSLPGAADFRAGALRAATWLRQQPAAGVDPVSTGAELRLLLAAGEQTAAVAAADALLARMTTPAWFPWGDPRFEDDLHALGGIASPWGTGSLQSPWFATYNVAGLLELGRATGSARYTLAATLLVGWLADKMAVARRDEDVVHVQDLRGGLVRIHGGSWWGLVPETYEPNTGTYVDWSGAELRTVPGLVLDWVAAPEVDLSQRSTSWMEARLGLDFERLLHDRVRGDAYYAHISQVYPWNGWTFVPRNLGEVSPSINPLLADDAALALLDYVVLTP